MKNSRRTWITLKERYIRSPSNFYPGLTEKNQDVFKIQNMGKIVSVVRLPILTNLGPRERLVDV